MNYLNKINEQFPIRRTAKEKNKFCNFIQDEVKKFNHFAKVEILENKHENIIIGDIEYAKVIITAHYDTPASSVIPNLLVPRNLLFGYLYHFGYPFLLALVSILLAYGIKEIFLLDQTIFLLSYIVIYLGVFLLLNRTFKNKHNKNDNTSGVSLILEMISKIKSNNVAYVLFDNEEKGLLGSKAFSKKYHQILDDKLIINFDCIGVGDNVLIIYKEEVLKNHNFDLLKKVLINENGYKCYYYPKKGSMVNSDFKNFKSGIGIMTCKKNKLIGFYTNRIHTNYDTIADDRNIQFISDKMIQFVKGIS